MGFQQRDVVVTFIRSNATGHTTSTDPSRSHYITSVGGRLKPTHRRRKPNVYIRSVVVVSCPFLINTTLSFAPFAQSKQQHIHYACKSKVRPCCVAHRHAGLPDYYQTTQGSADQLSPSGPRPLAAHLWHLSTPVLQHTSQLTFKRFGVRRCLKVLCVRVPLRLCSQVHHKSGLTAASQQAQSLAASPRESLSTDSTSLSVSSVNLSTRRRRAAHGQCRRQSLVMQMRGRRLSWPRLLPRSMERKARWPLGDPVGDTSGSVIPSDLR